jgi:hypothetical protein
MMNGGVLKTQDASLGLGLGGTEEWMCVAHNSTKTKFEQRTASRRFMYQVMYQVIMLCMI